MSERAVSALQYGEARNEVREVGEQLLAYDLTTGTGGNVSRRTGDGNVAISPSGLRYREIAPEDVPIIDRNGARLLGRRQPSVESPMHTMVYRERDDVGAVVHTHSPYASTLAVLGESIPPTHYLVASVGTEIPLAEYATFGTDELGRAVVEALDRGTDACLLEHHGVLAVGESLRAALDTALTVEFCARLHYRASVVGEPTRLPDEELETLRAKFEGYGQH